jgi:hypothetical protein
MFDIKLIIPTICASKERHSFNVFTVCRLESTILKSCVLSEGVSVRWFVPGGRLVTLNQIFTAFDRREVSNLYCCPALEAEIHQRGLYDNDGVPCAQTSSAEVCGVRDAASSTI